MKSREEVNLGEVLPRFQAGGEGLFLVLKLLTVSKHRRENRNGGRSSFHSAGESGGQGPCVFILDLERLHKSPAAYTKSFSAILQKYFLVPGRFRLARLWMSNYFRDIWTIVMETKSLH